MGPLKSHKCVLTSVCLSSIKNLNSLSAGSCINYIITPSHQLLHFMNIDFLFFRKKTRCSQQIPGIFLHHSQLQFYSKPPKKIHWSSLLIFNFLFTHSCRMATYFSARPLQLCHPCYSPRLILCDTPFHSCFCFIPP